MPQALEAAKTFDWETDDLGALSKEAAEQPDDLYGGIHSAKLRVRLVPAYSYTPRTFRRSDDEVAQEFTRLVREWREATYFEANLTHIVMHMSYQHIVGLGPQVIPLILRDLSETHGQWFWALAAIVGVDKAAGQTTADGAAEAWLAWGREAGLLE
jgi:hypothetical protein